jgi:hypothetical protein
VERHSQINHILTEKRQYSSVLGIRSYRGADCDTDHYLLVAKFKERLGVYKQTMHKFHMKRFNLMKQNEVEGKDEYQAEISNTFTALENR